MTVSNSDKNYPQRHIKELLDEFPALGELLEEYHIGCVACTVGTCQFQDILQIHSLPQEQMSELLAGIAQIVDPNSEHDLSALAVNVVSTNTPGGEIKYSPPLRDLVAEHALIKRWLVLIPAILPLIDLELAADRQLVLDGVEFIRCYADRFHHAKEEDILFKQFDGKQDIIQVMLADHMTGRLHVQGIVTAVETRDHALLTEHMIGYQLLLTEHIRKEDEILYPWMDRQLSTAQVGSLYKSFTAAEDNFDPGMAAKFAQFIDHLEQMVKESNNNE